MFEVAELGLKLSDQEFAGKEPELHMRLLDLQRKLQLSRSAVLIVIAGVEGAGKGGVVNRLNEWLDSRGIVTTAFFEETDEQALRPTYWRYWRTLPERGNIGIMFGSWYTRPIVERAADRIDAVEYSRLLHEITDFERMLSQDGVILIKLWYHMPKASVEKQLKADARNPRLKMKMRATRGNRRYAKTFDELLKTAEVALHTTDQSAAPWHIVEATDANHRDFSTGQIIADTLEQHLTAQAGAPPLPPAVLPALRKPAELTVLDILSPDIALEEKLYRRRLQKWQARLHQLVWDAHNQRRSVVVVFEGWDAAGKGSTIRRLTQAMDARIYKVISSGKPTDEEAAHHYLWRFWRHVPLDGYVSIYDRSWYGRVLVERVDKLASDAEWQRAYAEINLFERQLSDHGIIVLKFWLHISAEEQLKRFREREATPWKAHKLTADDWRNREQRDAYKQAVHDMVEHTSTAAAPWHLIPANDKKYARVDVLKSICRELKKAL